MDYENQQMIERIFNARQARALILKELGENQTLQAHARAAISKLHMLTPELVEDTLVHLVQAKRATIPALVGVLRYHFAGSPEPEQAAAVAIAAMMAVRLIGYDDVRKQAVVNYDISEHGHALIQQYMYLPPMIIPPLRIQDDGRNRGSGYITQRNDSLLLRDNHHEGDICVEHLNRLNQVALTINERVVKTLRNHWSGVERQQEDETFEDYQKRLKAFEKYEKDSFTVIALMIEMGNRFHLTHKNDKRGRSYCQGYHINYQGNTWNKACVELANKEKVHVQ